MAKASSGPRLAATPLPSLNGSDPFTVEDFHLREHEHARRTWERRHLACIGTRCSRREGDSCAGKDACVPREGHLRRELRHGLPGRRRRHTQLDIGVAVVGAGFIGP
ncbi:MAG TPA: hypothetical protein VJP78_12560, partial [Thermoleophilia bacterium]|nr:hypothetical protein [Thermoleophilia bacterium]